MTGSLRSIGTIQSILSSTKIGRPSGRGLISSDSRWPSSLKDQISDEEDIAVLSKITVEQTRLYQAFCSQTALSRTPEVAAQLQVDYGPVVSGPSVGFRFLWKRPIPSQNINNRVFRPGRGAFTPVL